MSVYYYITRNSGPFVKDGRQKITEAEWRAAVAADPDLAIEQPKESGPRGLLKSGDVEVKGMDEALFEKVSAACFNPRCANIL